MPSVYRLFQRFFRYRSFPGAAVDFLDDLFEQAADMQEASVTADQARELFAQRTGLPQNFLRDDEPLRVDDVFAALRRRVLGQDHACRLTAELIATFKAGLNDPQRPIGVLLFCGPTGVGKTELAKAASRYLFGHGEEQDRLVRIDCSEFAAHGSAELLLTRPDGEPGLLLSRVRQQPFVVVLLDEIEKASDDVFDLLLNLLEEGRLTDRFGRTTFFRSALLVMTSNLGARRGSSLGFAGNDSPNYEQAVLDFFRPEFVNRLDAIVPFEPLPHEVIVGIARKELTELADREGLAAAGLTLSFTERLVERVAEGGFDPRFGARPLQRFVERVVVVPLSQFLVAHSELRNAMLHIDLPPGLEAATVTRML